jgi:hypothetical protein
MALDVVAAAQAAAGRFDAAFETAAAALTLGPPDAIAAAIRQRQNSIGRSVRAAVILNSEF